MNIMIAATQLYKSNGGVCTHIIDLCKALTKTEKVVLVSDGTDFIDQINGIPGLTYVEIPFYEMDKGKKAIFKCYKMMRRLCKEHGIQIIHVHGQRVTPLAWILKLTRRIPFLWTNHIDAIPNPGLLAKMWKVMRFPIISVSTDLKNQLINELGIKENKITVVNNGVDISTLQPLTEEEKATCRSRFGIKPDTYVIAEVARINHVKGQHLLVRAVDALNKKNLGVKIQVLLAGAGEMGWIQHNVLDYCVENHVDCNYVGFCKPRDVYGIADLAVLSSLYEGFSISSIEALAVGCPVVRSDSPGHTDMKEIVRVCRKNDVDSLIEHIEYAITHREEMREMAKKGQKTVKERFTKEVMCEETFEVYQRILGE